VHSFVLLLNWHYLVYCVCIIRSYRFVIIVIVVTNHTDCYPTNTDIAGRVFDGPHCGSTCCLCCH
jgi:hypothetical protein